MTIQEIREAGHPEIAGLAEVRRKENNGYSTDITSTYCFNWHKTKEGYAFWTYVSDEMFEQAYQIVSLKKIKKRIGKKEMKKEKVNRIKDICKEAFRELLEENKNKVIGLPEQCYSNIAYSFVIEKNPSLPTNLFDVNVEYINESEPTSISKKYSDALFLFDTLLVARDVYRRGWKPDWSDLSDNYTISVYNNNLAKETVMQTNQIFSFQTGELRDKFLSNFKEELKELKELWN